MLTSVSSSPIAPKGTSKDTPLHRLNNHLNTGMKAVNQTILAEMQSDIEMIPQLAGYLIAAGGKRIRPLLTLAAAELAGYSGDGDADIKLATAVEFIHTATLLHDDVVDESDHRRGQPSANIEFGNQASVLVGDFLFSRAFQLMVQTGSLDVLDILSEASCVIAEGEVLQLAHMGDVSIERENYMRVIESKTAALFRAATHSGAVIAGADQKTVEALKTYGQAIGVAFQIVDDVLDYGGVSDRLGKDIGDDFREGKVTLPVVIAYAEAEPEERVFWDRCLNKGKIIEDDLSNAINYLHEHKALERSLEVASEYALSAKEALLSVDAKGSPLKPILSDLADFVVNRVY